MMQTFRSRYRLARSQSSLANLFLQDSVTLRA